MQHQQYRQHTVTATDVATGCFTNASVLVNYTPPAPTITPSSVTMCLGDPAVKLKATSSSSGTVTVNSVHWRWPFLMALQHGLKLYSLGCYT
ncbi:MAG: hypothetical protein IPO01_17675 [Chitinophagaceae bacterium]|nr:hypothetical protein [Chitinophagaceae bacterium]